MRTLLGHRPSPAMVVACIALAIALGGTSYAAFELPKNSVGTKQLKKGAVTKKKIAKKTIAALKGQTGPQGPKGDQGPPGPSTGPAGGDLTGNYPNPSIAAGVVGTSKIGDLQVTGAKVANDTLGASQINEADLDYASAACKLGLIHSFARIKGQASMPSTYTTSSTYVDFVHNCGGGTTEVRRPFGAGIYSIRFNGDPAALALAVPNWDESCPVGAVGSDHAVAVAKILTGIDAGGFAVTTQDPAGTNEDACVTVVTF